MEQFSLIRIHLKLAVFFFAIEALHNFDKIVTVRFLDFGFDSLRNEGIQMYLVRVALVSALEQGCK